MKLDIAIFSLLGILQVISASWGGYVSSKQLQDQPQVRRFHIAAFLLMALIGVGLTVAQGVRTYYQQKDAKIDRDRDKTALDNLQITENQTEASLSAAREDLRRSGLAQEYMKGQLSGLGLMVGHLNDSTIGTNKELATAIQKVAEADSKAQDTRSALERMSNSSLRLKVVQFSKEILDWNASQEVAQQKMFEARQNEMRAIGRDDKAKQETTWNAWNARDMQFNRNYSLEFTKDFVPAGIAYRDELIRRLGPQPIPKLGPGDPRPLPLAIDGWISIWSVPATATYLQGLAMKLSDK